jgi:hypothetical protein
MEKSVEVLATLLEQKPEVIEEAIKTDGELDKLVDQYKTDHHVFSSGDLARKIENANRDYIEKLAADGQQLPSALYNRVKGNAFEKQEKQWAKEHDIDTWDNIDDLKTQIIAKEIAKSGKAGGDAVVKEMEAKIDELKKLVLAESELKEKAVTEERAKVGRRMIDFDIINAIKSVDIDAEGEKLENQRGMLDAVFKRDFSCEYRDDKTVVLDKDGKMIVNKVGDPLSVSDVLNDIAPKWVDIKEVSKGGRGGSPTKGKPDGTLKTVMNINELVIYAEGKGILPGTAEFLALMIEVQKENPDYKK